MAEPDRCGPRVALWSPGTVALAAILLGACEPEAAPAPAPGTGKVAANAAGPIAPVADPAGPLRVGPDAPLTRGQSRIPAELRGDWTVVRQTVVGDGIQANGENDPALIGAILRVTATEAAWPNQRDPLTGHCKDPYFDGQSGRGSDESLAEPLRRAGAEESRTLAFLCMGAGSDWGPGQEELRLILLTDGRIALRWFDNLLLVLERRPG